MSGVAKQMSKLDTQLKKQEVSREHLEHTACKRPQVDCAAASEEKKDHRLGSNQRVAAIEAPNIDARAARSCGLSQRVRGGGGRT